MPNTTASITQAHGVGSRPRGALNQLATAINATSTLYASDLGYRTLPSDSVWKVYPPYLDTAFAIDRQVPLDPNGLASSLSWGSLVLLNPNGVFDSVAATENTDTRALRIYIGRKAPATDGRNILLDPSSSTLVQIFSGFAKNWQPGDANITVPITDPTYWLDAPLQQNFYSGAGGYGGTADLAGKPKPKARGGSVGYPIINVTPVLIDPVNLIYQFTDAGGAVINLYEGGLAGTILPQGDTTNLYAGTTAPGYYRTDISRGLFQLGSTPASGRAITCDVTGWFPLAGSVQAFQLVASALLYEDCQAPASYVNDSAFAALGTGYNYRAGIFFPPDPTITCRAAVNTFFGGAGIRLMANRAGQLTPWRPQAISGTPTPAAVLTVKNTISLVRQPLPAALDPPPGAFNVGYNRNNTVQTSGLSPTLSAARILTLSQVDQLKGYTGNFVVANYRRPNYPAAIGGAFLDPAGATAAAAALGGLWCANRRLFAVTVPLALGLSLDLGSIVQIVWPAEDLAGGKYGQIVGDSVRSNQSTMVLQVLV